MYTPIRALQSGSLLEPGDGIEEGTCHVGPGLIVKLAELSYNSRWLLIFYDFHQISVKASSHSQRPQLCFNFVQIKGQGA